MPYKCPIRGFCWLHLQVHRIPQRRPYIDVRPIGEAQGWRCAACRVTLTGPVSPHIEGPPYTRNHIIPRRPPYGHTPGEDVPENIQLLCRPCNERKGNRMVEEGK